MIGSRIRRRSGAHHTGGGGGGGCGVVLNTIYDDNFDCGSSIDTAGTRFSGANPWSFYHMSDGIPPSGTATQSGGLLTFFGGSYLGGGGPRALLQSLPAGSGDWRFRVKTTPINYNSSFPLHGVILRESSTDKSLICGGGVEVTARGISPWGTWGPTYGSGSNIGGADTDVTYIELTRTSGALTIRVTHDATDGEDLTTPLTTGFAPVSSQAQTTNFTTAPDQWGLMIVGDSQSSTFDWVKRLA